MIAELDTQLRRAAAAAGAILTVHEETTYTRTYRLARGGYSVDLAVDLLGLVCDHQDLDQVANTVANMIRRLEATDRKPVLVKAIDYDPGRPLTPAEQRLVDWCLDAQATEVEP